MKAAKPKFSAEARKLFGDYKPSAKKRAAIDAKIREAIGKNAVEGLLGARYSNNEQGQPYERYYLSNGHTCFVSGFVSGEIHVTVTDKPASKSSWTVKHFLAKKERLKAKAAAAKAESK